MKLEEVSLERVTPMMRQYIDIKNRNKDVIVFFRLGDFYEMFFEDAILVSKILELTLTGKSAGLDERIPMCGVPHHSANIYIEKLVELGYKVGICEQLEDAKNVKGIVKRDIIRIVSKGTIMNNESLLEYENNYIGNIVYFKDCLGIAYTDISTGEVNVKIVENDYLKIVNEIINLNLKEVIVTNNINNNIIITLEKQFNITVSIYNNFDIKNYDYVFEEINDVRMIETIKHLLSYLNETQKTNMFHLQKATIKEDKNYLKMDIHTKRNLELIETKRLKQRQFSLIWLLDKTKTAMGSRLLKKYIENPLIDKVEIEKKYDIVDVFINKFLLKKELESYLNEVYDLERLSGRIAFGNSNAKDMLQLKKSLNVFPNINNLLKEINYSKFLNPLVEVYELLENAIYENPPMSIKEGYLIKDGYHEELDNLKELRKGGKDFLAKFEIEEKERTGIKTLKVGYNRIFGYYIEVSKGSINLIKDEFGYERKQTLSNCERYISPVLKEKEAMILNAEEKIIELEYELFIKIRDIIKNYIGILQENSKIISEIDVLQSFSTVAEENNYVRPRLTEQKIIEIIDNRHPIIEKVNTEEFVPNDIILNEDTDILLITGPNMAGKSTYIRQLAITTIMAQIGSFVPAKSALLHVVDAIFTRIGSSDDLVSGESTFMVEMNEANYAISNATTNSLILFDELGRGTATFDGMAIAQAIIEYIHNNIKAKALFSTHYHELTDLENELPRLKNVHVSAYEENGNLTFLHKIKFGSVDKSYGIHVAKLAKLPDSLIKRAGEILNVYENLEIKRDNKINNFEKIIEVEKDSLIETEINNINISELTPLEAMNLLYKLQNKIKNKET